MTLRARPSRISALYQAHGRPTAFFMAQPITLHFQNIVRIAGESIEGRVDLNVALAQDDHIEHLRIKLRGALTTCALILSGANSY
jgi:hypothetical protein